MHCVNLYYRCGHSGVIALNEESTKFAWIGNGELTAYDIAFRDDKGLKRFLRLPN